MSVIIKSEAEISGIKRASRMVGESLRYIQSLLEAGMRTKEIEELVEEFVDKKNATLAFKGYRGFPASICISVNEEVVHGIPGNRKIEEGDIVSVDIGIEKDGFYSDGACTFPIGRVENRKMKLIQITRSALYHGIRKARIGNYISDISHAIQEVVEKKHFSIVKELSGHGVGIKLHEDPHVPNFGNPGHGMELREGMTLAIEPMVNLGNCEVHTLADGWTVVTSDGLPSAHFEHTILVTSHGPRILTEL